ncbi:MAG: M42 family peptidase [Acidobacteria bacterium]|nr:MAG: M42 family peptidase [Acidobacteriota bacterium]
MRKESLDFLKELLSAPSPSGFESAGQRIWCRYARKYADEVRTDAYGNAVAVLNPGGDPKIMLDGHADEIGLMVKYIDDKGFIYFQPIGGVDPSVVRTKRVDIHAAKGIVRGVIGAKAHHLQDRTKEAKAPKMHECFIDIGAHDGKEARKKVSVGDPITFAETCEMLDKNIMVARALDDRIGTWAAIEVLRLLSSSKNKLNCAVYASSSCQEEVGLVGATMTVFNVKPDVAIALEVTHATDTPGIDAKQFGEVKMGSGPTISIGREHHPVLVNRLQAVAETKKIKLQTEAFSLNSGTNAMAFHKAEGGIPSALISVPNRYMHTTVEMIDLRDLQTAVNLLGAFCLDIKQGERFKVKI